MTNRSRTIIKGLSIPTESADLNAPKVRRLEIDRYHEELAQDEQEKRGGWFNENANFFSEKGKAE